MGFLIQKLPFAWWLREIAQLQSKELRFQATSLLTFQEVVEA